MAPVISGHTRVPASTVAFGSWAIAITIGILFAGQPHASPVDRWFSAWVHSVFGDRGRLAALLLVPTDTSVIAAAVVGVVVVALVRHRGDVALLAAGTPIIGVGLVELAFKPLFDRTLHGYLSYPSGHAVASMAAYTVALLAFASSGGPLRRWLAAAAWGLLTAIVVIGLVAMDCHYPTDAVGGVFVAVGVTVPCVLGTDRRLRHQADIRIPAQRPAPPVVAVNDGGRRTTMTQEFTELIAPENGHSG
jgi:undecaprenyl-diphosphatase